MKMIIVKCSVVNCGNNKKNNVNKVNFHCFPKDEKLVKIWKKFCRRPHKWIPPQKCFICSVHFAENCFEVVRLALNEDDDTIKRLIKNCK